MSENYLEDIYHYRPLPWMSKSTVLSHNFCEWLFKLDYIDGRKTEVGLAANTGSSMHALCARFFDQIDMDKLLAIPIDYESEVEFTSLYDYIYGVLIEMIPKESRGYEAYQRILKNFAILECQHWKSLHEMFDGLKSKVLAHFVPTYVEKYIEFPEAMLHGTIDRKNIVYKGHKKRSKIHEIYDYKTGNVPKQVIRGPKRPTDEYSWTLPTSKMFELHFYMMLDLINRGYKLNDDLLDYLTNPQRLGDSVPKTPEIFYTPQGKVFDFRKHYVIGIIYLGHPAGPYIPKKTPNRRSMRSVLRKINHLRKKIYAGEDATYEKDPNYFKCIHCSSQDICLTDEEVELFGLEEEDV